MALSSEAQEKLRRQVEFYFSDVNIQKDVFLKAKMAESPEGFVPVVTLLTFNRVNAVTRDAEALSAALQSSEQLVLSEDGLMVRRKAPLPESIQTDDQTVYVKPLPPGATLEELTQFFGKHGTVQAVWRRYFQGKKEAAPENRTKPSVFVVFGSKDEAEKFKSAPPEYDGVQLTTEMKTVYLERKAEEMAAKNKGRKRQPQDQQPQADARRTPSMPMNSSYRVSGCGSVERFSDVKGLWPAEEQKGIRYVFTPDKETALLIFQDAETADKMVADLQQRGTTLNGKQPALQKLADAEEKALLENVEKEIADRAKANVNAGGRGRGRGGRGRGGRGRGGQKRSRDD